MERLREKVETARKALATLLTTGFDAKPDLLHRDAAIQRFEYSFEAVWKAVQRFLEICEGISTASPKACIRYSREAGLLTDREAVLGLELVAHRNLTVHTYNEKLAIEIYKALPAYASLMDSWLGKVEARLKKAKKTRKAKGTR